MYRGRSVFDRNSTQWSHCLDRLYDAVGQERHLASALGEFRSFVDARGVTFLTIPDMRHPETSHTGSMGVSETALVEYHTHFNVHDEWVLAAQRRPDFLPGVVYRGSDLVPREQLRQSYFWKAFLQRNGVIDILTAVIELPSEDSPASFITFHRHEGQQPFARADVAMLRELAPHLRHVLRLHRRLAPALAVGSTLLELVQGLAQPVCFVAADGRIVQCNEAARSAMATGGSGWLRQSPGARARLQVAGVDGWQELAPELADLGPQGRGVIDLVSEDHRYATLQVHRIHHAESDRLAQHPAWAVCTLAVGARDAAQQLRQRYRLTAAEARVAMQLAQGQTAAEVAASAGISMTTVRTHIQNVLGKMGLSRQSQLVARVVGM